MHAFFAITESKKRRARRKLYAWVAEIFQRAKCDAESEGVVGFCPGGEGEKPAHSQHAMRLANGCVRLRQVQYAKVHHRTVESSVFETQRFGIANLKFNSRI